MKKILTLILLSTSIFALSITPESNLSTESKFSGQESKMYFGEQLFKGNFRSTTAFQQDPDYLLKVGDVVSLKLWGAYDFSGELPIDKQGNIFIPQVGTAHLLGLKNKELQPELSAAITEVFKDNVQVYANVENYQPLSVFVSGSVKNVGLYNGYASDSILQFIDKAGGIIRGEGSYRHISILRNKHIIKNVDLYDFLLHGYSSHFEFRDGDVILVRPIRSYIEVDGDVSRPYIFELMGKSASVKSIIKYVLPKAGVNRFIHTKRQSGKELSHAYSIADANRIRLHRGDKVNFFSNLYVQSISVAIDGEHKGTHYVSVPKGTSVYDVLSKVSFSPLSNIRNIQLYRKSVAQVQKQLLDEKLKDLEARALTTDSATSEEAAIRSKEADLLLKFIQRAKSVEPKGEVVLSAKEDLRRTVLEDGDRLFIPRKSNVVVVQGEVGIPNALTYQAGKSLAYYVDACGGYTDRANKSKVLLIKANGAVIQHNGSALGFGSPTVEAGDSILVLGKTDTKNLLLAKDITQILYQVAVGAAVVLKAF